MHGMVQAPDFRGNVQDIHVYVEPSLSSFGSPDVVVLADYEDGFKRAFFVEAKVGTFGQSVGLGSQSFKAFNENSSSVLHEIFLKARFQELLEKHPNLLRDGVLIYSSSQEKPRKIGTDPMVLELVDALKGRITYFVSLTTDPTLPIGTPWPANLRAVAESMGDIHDTNATADPHVTYGNPLGGWIECSLHMGWDQVLKWAQRHNLTRLLDTVNENRCKFSLPGVDTATPSPPTKSAIDFYEDFFTNCCGLSIGNVHGGRTRLKDDVVVATYQIVESLYGEPHKPWVSIYFTGGGSGLFSYDEIHSFSSKGSVLLRDLKASALRVGWSP